MQHDRDQGQPQHRHATEAGRAGGDDDAARHACCEGWRCGGGGRVERGEILPTAHEERPVAAEVEHVGHEVVALVSAPREFGPLLLEEVCDDGVARKRRDVLLDNDLKGALPLRVLVERGGCGSVAVHLLQAELDQLRRPIPPHHRLHVIVKDVVDHRNVAALRRQREGRHAISVEHVKGFVAVVRHDPVDGALLIVLHGHVQGGVAARVLQPHQQPHETPLLRYDDFIADAEARADLALGLEHPDQFVLPDAPVLGVPRESLQHRYVAYTRRK